MAWLQIVNSPHIRPALEHLEHGVCILEHGGFWVFAVLCARFCQRWRCRWWWGRAPGAVHRSHRGTGRGYPPTSTAWCARLRTRWPRPRLVRLRSKVLQVCLWPAATNYGTAVEVLWAVQEAHTAEGRIFAPHSGSDHLAIGLVMRAI